MSVPTKPELPKWAERFMSMNWTLRDPFEGFDSAQRAAAEHISRTTGFSPERVRQAVQEMSSLKQPGRRETWPIEQPFGIKPPFTGRMIAAEIAEVPMPIDPIEAEIVLTMPKSTSAEYRARVTQPLDSFLRVAGETKQPVTFDLGGFRVSATLTRCQSKNNMLGNESVITRWSIVAWTADPELEAQGQALRNAELTAHAAKGDLQAGNKVPLLADRGEVRTSPQTQTQMLSGMDRLAAAEKDMLQRQLEEAGRRLAHLTRELEGQRLEYKAE